jgi:hypothetical protein
VPDPSFLSAWQTYYFVLATAAATLAGLLFVGLTFSVGAIRGDIAKAVRMWGEPPLYDFIQVLVIGCLAELPDLTAPALGGALLAWSAWRIWRLVEIIAYFKGLDAQGDLDLSDWMERAVYPGLLYAALIIAGLGFLYSRAWASPVLALDCLGVLYLGIYSTWTQLAWMTEQKSQEPQKKSKS